MDLICPWTGVSIMLEVERKNAKDHLDMLNKQLMRYREDLIFIAVIKKYVNYLAGLET